MNEKGLIVLEQYELDVRSARRGRGSFLVDTDQGLKLLTEYAGTEGRLEFQDRVMRELREKGLERLDFPVQIGTQQVANAFGTHAGKDRTADCSEPGHGYDRDHHRRSAQNIGHVLVGNSNVHDVA